MKKQILLILILSVYFNLFSQKSLLSPVIVYSISDNAVIKISGKEIKLDSLLVCNFNDEIEVVKGKVCAYSGSDNYLSPGDKINIIQKNNDTPNDIDKISRFINDPSVYLPNLYNNTRGSAYKIYPTLSNLYSIENLSIYLPERIHHKFDWRLYNQPNDFLIVKIDKVASDFIPQTLKLEKGQIYYWKLYNRTISFRGQFKFLKNLKNGATIPAQLNSKAEYLKTFNIFIENRCYFDAIAILKEGLKKYPDCKIISNLLLKAPYL